MTKTYAIALNNANLNKGGLCMKGNIYTREKCESCGGTLRYNANVSAFICDKHFDRRVIPAGVNVKFGRDINKRFTDLELAEQFLNGLRFKTSEGSFDKRDYKKGNPLGFANQARKWLETKKGVSTSLWR